MCVQFKKCVFSSLHLCQQFLKLYTHVSIHNANAYEMFSDSHNYFTFSSQYLLKFRTKII